MSSNKIVLEMGSFPNRGLGEGVVVINTQELKAMIKSGKIFSHLFKYSEASLFTYKVDFINKPLMMSVLLRIMGRGRCRFEDMQGGNIEITVGRILNYLGCFATELLKMPLLLKRIGNELETELINCKKGIANNSPHDLSRLPLDLSGSPAYLRPGLDFGIMAGGSVGHIAGVLNNLDAFSGSPVFLTTDKIPTVREDIETHVILPGGAFRDFREIPMLAFNYEFSDRALEILKGRKISFIYQRYGLSNFSAVRLARSLRVPLVTEFNGSEVWVSRNWGSPVKYDDMLEKVERLNVNAADVVVVVSKPLKDGLIDWGVDPDKVLVNPNGVDPVRYSPEIDGSEVRKRLGLEGKLVIGFIGTFGRWHGAEVLAESFGMLLGKYPELRTSVRALMIGDGMTMPEVKKNLQKFGVTDLCTLTGIVPQKEGPAHLAACDILASPHVPNPDGTKFFGSPTKLFEYMAMGKGIVASELEQIGEILEHEKTAYMVEPGNAEAFMEGLKALIDDPEKRSRLGENARKEAVEKYSWREHTRKIIEKLKERKRQNNLSLN